MIRRVHLDIYRAIGSTETANELQRMIHVGCGGGVTRRRGVNVCNAASGVVGELDGGRLVVALIYYSCMYVG